MSEKSEVQNLDEATEATEPLDAAPAAEDAGHVAHGGPRKYGEEGSGSVDELRDTDVHADEQADR